MAKRNIPSVKERKLARLTQEIDILLGLDMDPEARTSEEKAIIIAKMLPHWENPPPARTLSKWRSHSLYQERRDAILGDDTMVERLQYWAQTRYVKQILPAYDEILKQPMKAPTLWWRLSERIREMAGLTQPQQNVSIVVLEFLQAHMGIVEGAPPPPMITMERADDGTVIDATFQVLDS